MAFTMAELRGELANLGYGSLPDEFIISSLSHLQLGTPQPWDNVDKVNKGGVSSSSRAVAGRKSSRQVHGDPVPGDREFAEKTKSRGRSRKELGPNTGRNGGLDSVCFTPGFANELDEMRKMLKIMHATKEELFGPSPSSLSTQRSTRKRVGLADEHELYVGNLLDQWRVVGKTIRGKRNGSASLDVRALPTYMTNGAASSSENGGHHHTSSFYPEDTRKPQGAFLESKILPPAEAPSTSSRGLDRYDEGYDPQAGSNTRAEREEQGNGFSERGCLVGKVEMDHRQEEGTAAGGIIETHLNEGDLQGGIGVRGHEITGPVFTRQESSSAISPGVSYQPGGMLYPENFSLEGYNEQPGLPGTNEESLPQSHHEAEEDNPSSPSQRSSSKQTLRQALDKLSAHSKDKFLAAFHQSLDDLDPRDILERETFGDVNQKIPDRTPVSVLSGHPLAQQPVVESENPLNSGVPPVSIRTPDRRGGGGAHQSPLNDRSNLRIAVEVDPALLSNSRAKPKKKTEPLSPAALKRNSSVTTKRSRSSRGISRRNEIGEEANDAHPSDIVPGGGRGDSRLLSENTTPPPSLRKLKSERVPRYPISEISPKVTVRNKGVVDESDLDIPSFGLSPIKIRESSFSPRNNFLSSRERSCVANGSSEHRLGSHCTACYPPSAPTLRKSGDSNSQSTTATSKSPVGRSSSETVLSTTEASPQQKRSSVKKEAAGVSSAKQKLPLKKSSAGPSGIYTPLVDPKKTDSNSNSKVLLKTRRLASSMEFASDTSRLTDRRTPPLRSSTESSRSSGPQRATSSQSQVSKSLSGSSPYAKTSSFGGSRSSTPKDMLSSPFGKASSFASYGSQSSTTKDTLTPGGPRRGGKVDRVARFAEMQNLWKKDKFLKTSVKRKPQSFHRIFARLHLSHERCTAAYRERVLEEMRPSTEQPPFVVPTLLGNSEGVCIF